jgi:CubicO group peptidase (beta-lactamase class C family)
MIQKLKLLGVLSIALLRLTFAYCPPTGPVLPPPVIQNIDKLTNNITKTLQEVSKVSIPNFNLTTTSFSVQITSPDDIIYQFHHTAPVRNMSGVDKVDGDSVYRVASVTKMMTVYALLLQEGVNLDDPVTNFVPGLLEAGLDNYRNVTLRMLASQTSGTARDGMKLDVDATGK